MVTKEKQREAPAAPKPAAPRIRWDDSRMTSSYANVCNAASSREEVTLLFGVNQSWHPGQPEVTVQLQNRIVLSPYAAKRLALLLTGLVRQYESRYGELRVDAPAASATPAPAGSRRAASV